MVLIFYYYYFFWKKKRLRRNEIWFRGNKMLFWGNEMIFLKLKGFHFQCLFTASVACLFLAITQYFFLVSRGASGAWINPKATVWYLVMYEYDNIVLKMCKWISAYCHKPICGHILRQLYKGKIYPTWTYLIGGISPCTLCLFGFDGALTVSASYQNNYTNVCCQAYSYMYML